MRPHFSSPISDRRRRKKKKQRPPAFKIRRKPNPRMRTALLNVSNVLAEEGYTYREAQSMFRAFFLEVILAKCDRHVTAAAKKLGLSRLHLRRSHERGRKVVEHVVKN
jgi:hypothetical protein